MVGRSENVRFPAVSGRARERLFQVFENRPEVLGLHHADWRKEPQVIRPVSTTECDDAIFKEIVEEFANLLFVSAKRRQSHHAAVTRDDGLRSTTERVRHRWEPRGMLRNKRIRVLLVCGEEFRNATIHTVVTAALQSPQHRESSDKRAG